MKCRIRHDGHPHVSSICWLTLGVACTYCRTYTNRYLCLGMKAPLFMQLLSPVHQIQVFLSSLIQECSKAALFCRAVLCCAMPCCALLCQAVPCCAVPCCDMACCAVPCCAMPCCAMPWLCAQWSCTWRIPNLLIHSPIYFH